MHVSIRHDRQRVHNRALSIRHFTPLASTYWLVAGDMAAVYNPVVLIDWVAVLIARLICIQTDMGGLASLHASIT